MIFIDAPKIDQNNWAKQNNFIFVNYFDLVRRNQFPM